MSAAEIQCYSDIAFWLLLAAVIVDIIHAGRVK